MPLKSRHTFLKRLFQANTFNELPKLLRGSTRFIAEQNQNKLKKLFPKSQWSLSILEPLTNIATYPILIFWTAVTIISLTTPVLLALCAATGLLTLGFMYLGYRVTQQNQNDGQCTQEKTALLMVKIQTLKTLLNNDHQQIALISKNNPGQFQWISLAAIKESLEAMLLTTYTLLGTYYLGCTAITTALGTTALSTFLSSPVGLCVCLSAAFLVGLFFGYNTLQAAREKDFVANREDELQTELNQLWNLSKKRLLNPATQLSCVTSTGDNQTPNLQPLFKISPIRSGISFFTRLKHQPIRNHQHKSVEVSLTL
jgi:hypothetical protein